MTAHTNKICFPVYANMPVEDALAGVLCCRMAMEKKLPFSTHFQGADTPVYMAAEQFSALCDLAGNQPHGHIYYDLNDFIAKYTSSLPFDELRVVKSWASHSPLHLPSVFVYMLFRRMPPEDFFNFLAHKLMTVPDYDITRDPDVVDILNPRSDADV